MNDSGKTKEKIKVTVIGDGGVGKTSLIQRFIHGTFQKDYIKTIGAQISNYKVEKEGRRTELLFWDFHFLRPSFYKASKAAIIVYSLEENSLGTRSFEHIRNWLKDVKEFCGNVPVILFANKVDLIKEENMNKDHLEKLVNDNNFTGYFITSAKTGKRVENAFNFLIDALG